MPNIYNFLPPYNQFQGQSYDADLTARMDGFLPQYYLTSGTIVPLMVDGSNVPTNINGSTGPLGPGMNGDPPAATPFMMMAYAQTSQGIVQFVLMDGATIPFGESEKYNSIPGPGKISDGYYFFVPVNNILDYSRVVQVYYTIDNLGPNSYSAPEKGSVRFYDANLVRANPTQSIFNSEIIGDTDYFFSKNSYASWPMKADSQASNDGYGVSLYFCFDELVNPSNPLETEMKAGKFYHPYFIALTERAAGSKVPSGYINYNNIQSNGFYSYQGYGPGFPVNINYTNVPLQYNQIPAINNGLDQIPFLQYQFPQPVSLDVYNFSATQVQNVISDNGNLPGLDNYIADINKFYDNGGFLPCSCPDNNNCAGGAYSYYQNNCNTIQAGIANYLTYQFIPISQIRTPTNFVVTDPNNIGNTGYTYVTLPATSGGTGFQPSVTSIGGTGTYPIQTQYMIDTSTGATGTTPAQGSIVSGWMQNPQSLTYQCSREVTPSEYCGFLDYFDSLFGITYSYGTCGATGNQDPFSKGACQTGSGATGICIPNYSFLQNYDNQLQPAFICVEPSVGVTYENLSQYNLSIPKRGLDSPGVFLPPQGTTNFGDPPAEKTNETNNIWIYIAIFIGVVLLVIVIVVLVKGFKKNKSSLKSIGQVTLT